jgi:hypothetical protein
MKTETTKTQKFTERHIINGSANLNYSFKDVSQLDEKSQLDWYWFAIVGLKMNVTHKQLLAETNKELIFEMIQDAIFTKESKKFLNNGSLNLNGFITDSVAQLQTILAYGDTDKGNEFKINCRQLQFTTECENLYDLLECARIVDSYNEYAYKNILKGSEYFKKQVFYSETNPNNNNDLFKFTFGRESSPVIYVNYSTLKTDYKYIVNRNGATVEVAEYTKEMFKLDMKCAANIFKCDEFSIDEQTHAYGLTSLTARFWFD